MKLTDPYVLKQLKIVNSTELEELIETYPEDERDGRSDIQILWEELNWLLHMYTNENYGQNYDLWEALDILGRTQNGKKLYAIDGYGNDRQYYPHENLPYVKYWFMDDYLEIQVRDTEEKNDIKNAYKKWEQATTAR